MNKITNPKVFLILFLFISFIIAFLIGGFYIGNHEAKQAQKLNEIQ